MTTENTTKDFIPQLSFVMVVHNQGEMLEHNLPLFLSQPCQMTYEVIVVDDTSTDNTSDVLKQQKEEYPNLYTTFMPVSVTNPSRLRLAMTIGIKAAKGEWIVLADIQRPPTSPEWQKTRRGLYDAVSVRKDRVFDAIRYYDQIVRGRKLAGLRLHVIWKTLTHQS